MDKNSDAGLATVVFAFIMVLITFNIIKDQSVPKYNGDVQKLAVYIFNTRNIDPAFPPMPKQGLKKKKRQHWLSGL